MDWTRPAVVGSGGDGLAMSVLVVAARQRAEQRRKASR
jgi:hypothetical protein